MTKFEINKKVFENFPELESGRLIFRQILLDDSEKLFEIRSNSEVMKFMDVEPMKSLAEAENLISSVSESFRIRTGINWGIVEKHSNEFIGYFGFWRIDVKNCRGEIGYALHPKFWDKGYMSETLNTLIEYGFNELHLHSIEANVNPYNLSSIKLLEKVGCKQEAYFKESFLFRTEFKDSIIYSLLKKDFIKT